MADPSFAPFVEVATAQVAAAVLVTAVLAPLLAAWVLKREGGAKIIADDLAKDEAANEKVDAKAAATPDADPRGNGFS